MNERDGEFNALLAGTSLDTPAARRLRQRTSPRHAELAKALAASPESQADDQRVGADERHERLDPGQAGDQTHGPAQPDRRATTLHRDISQATGSSHPKRVVAPYTQSPSLDVMLDAARGGDESGMAELWHALNPLILRYLRVVVGQAAEDVASETWLQAARDVRRFRGDGAGFRVWLFRVARNRALEELRRSGRRREDPTGLAADYAPERLANDDPAREAVERMASMHTLRLIAELPANQAEAVMLRVVVGFDTTQTAEVLGTRPGAIRIAAMRGLRRLATVINGSELLEDEHAGLERTAQELGQLRD